MLFFHIINQSFIPFVYRIFLIIIVFILYLHAYARVCMDTVLHSAVAQISWQILLKEMMFLKNMKVCMLLYDYVGIKFTDWMVVLKMNTQTCQCTLKLFIMLIDIMTNCIIDYQSALWTFDKKYNCVIII